MNHFPIKSFAVRMWTILNYQIVAQFSNKIHSILSEMTGIWESIEPINLKGCSLNFHSASSPRPQIADYKFPAAHMQRDCNPTSVPGNSAPNPRSRKPYHEYSSPMPSTLHMLQIRLQISAANLYVNHRAPHWLRLAKWNVNPIPTNQTHTNFPFRLNKEKYSGPQPNLGVIIIFIFQRQSFSLSRAREHKDDKFPVETRRLIGDLLPVRERGHRALSYEPIIPSEKTPGPLAALHQRRLWHNGQPYWPRVNCVLSMWVEVKSFDTKRQTFDVREVTDFVYRVIYGGSSIVGSRFVKLS